MADRREDDLPLVAERAGGVLQRVAARAAGPQDEACRLIFETDFFPEMLSLEGCREVRNSSRA